MQIEQDAVPAEELWGFNHLDDVNFWKRVDPESEEPPRVHDQKTFANIECLIKREFPETPESPESPQFPATLRKILKILKRFLLTDEHEQVRVRNFIRLTKWFGPFTRSGNSCVFLEQINKLSSYLLDQNNARVSPFAGVFTQDQAEEYLLREGVKVQSYLVQFSESLTNQGGFSLAVKANATEVRHYNIVGNPQTAARNQPYNARLKLLHRRYQHLNEEEYRDIVHFMRSRLDDDIEDCIYCTYICPNLPYSAVFRGYD